MPQKLSTPTPPTGLSRILFRLPIWLYRVRLGWLLGKRFLLLNHVGRKSGLMRQVVVEVVRYDSESDAYIIASGFGPKAQWYQNLRHQPEITIQVGGRKMTTVATFLESEEGAFEMQDYGRRYPSTARNLARFMGYQVDGSSEDYAALGQLIPFVSLKTK